jgi:hypothetical protein
MSHPSVQQLQRAIKISAQIEKLQEELSAILGQPGPSPAYRVPASVLASTTAAAKPVKRKKSKMSPEGRAAIIAAQKARWARVHAEREKRNAKK